MDEMTPKETKEESYEPIRLLEIELSLAKAKWLERHGWEESCQFPDSCWRWWKEIGGQMMMCSKSEAIKIERDFVD